MAEDGISRDHRLMDPVDVRDPRNLRLAVIHEGIGDQVVPEEIGVCRAGNLCRQGPRRRHRDARRVDGPEGPLAEWMDCHPFKCCRLPFLSHRVGENRQQLTNDVLPTMATDSGVRAYFSLRRSRGRRR